MTYGNLMEHAELERRFLAQEEFLGNDKPVNRIEPVVSVCVVTYQQAHLIGQCLDGILMQETSFPFEIILGEDESADGTREICMDYARRHPDRIRLFLRSRALSNFSAHGMTKRLNGVWTRRSARGRYVALCEGDDYWTAPDKLQKQVDFLEAHPECSMCFHNALVVKEGSPESSQPAHANDRMLPLYDVYDLLREMFICTATIAFRRSALVQPPPSWWYRMPMGDWPLALLVTQNGRVGYLPDTMSVYRMHSGGIWSPMSRYRQLEQTAVAFEVILTEFAPTLPEPERAISVVHCAALDAYREMGRWRPALRHARAVPSYALRLSLSRARAWLSDLSRAHWPWLWEMVRKLKIRPF
jgi:glycosyltransferase involved in cell wall biosynthesis